jgi:hypothetical protein
MVTMVYSHAVQWQDNEGDERPTLCIVPITERGTTTHDHCVLPRRGSSAQRRCGFASCEARFRQSIDTVYRITFVDINAEMHVERGYCVQPQVFVLQDKPPVH